MNMQPIRRALAVAVIAGALFSCGTPPANTTLIEALPTLREAVTVATGHPEQALELMASPAHLRILVSGGATD